MSYVCFFFQTYRRNDVIFNLDGGFYQCFAQRALVFNVLAIFWPCLIISIPHKQHFGSISNIKQLFVDFER